MKNIIFIAIVLVSCNKSFFVSKDRVIHETTGYLLYRKSECLFLKDDELSDFFKKVRRNDGCRIYQGCGLESMKYLAKEYIVETKYEDHGKVIGIIDTIRIVPAKLRYLPIKFKISEQVDVEFEYNHITYQYKLWDLFNGEVLSIDQVVSN